ncbi:hypothetical protein [Bacillus sp. C1]
MNIKKLYSEIEKQNFYIEQLVIKCIELIETKKNKDVPFQKTVMFEYQLVLLSSVLVNKTNVMKRKAALCVTVMNILNITDNSIMNTIKSSISSHVLTDLKNIEFYNHLCGKQFNENIKQLESILFEDVQI